MTQHTTPPEDPLHAHLPLMAVVLIALAAHSAGLQLGYAGDDYALVSNPIVATGQVLGQGRPLALLVFRLLEWTHLQVVPAGAFFAIAANVALAWVALESVETWGEQGHAVTKVVLASVIVCHPYQAEIFSFRGVLVQFTVAMLLLGAFLKLTQSRAGTSRAIVELPWRAPWRLTRLR